MGCAALETLGIPLCDYTWVIYSKSLYWWQSLHPGLRTAELEGGVQFRLEVSLTRCAIPCFCVSNHCHEWTEAVCGHIAAVAQDSLPLELLSEANSVLVSVITCIVPAMGQALALGAEWKPGENGDIRVGEGGEFNFLSPDIDVVVNSLKWHLLAQN